MELVKEPKIFLNRLNPSVELHINRIKTQQLLMTLA